MDLQLPRGTRDFPPAEAILRNEVIGTMVEIFRRYGFNPLETPILERWEILSAKYAGGEEILKETYKLSDQGGRELGLRYDLTTPLARFIGMNPNVKRPFKRYHIGPVYRDGPIRHGRYREFYQCDVDTVGVRSPIADAELIWVALDVFQQLGFEIEIQLNHRDILRKLVISCGISDSTADSAILSIDKLQKIGTDGVRNELVEKGVPVERANQLLNILDMPKRDNHEIMETIKENIGKQDPFDSSTPKAFLQLERMIELLPNDGRVKIVPSLARGLGYYTGAIFEVISHNPSFDGAVAAGGRWDRMISSFIGSDLPYPAAGISFGLEPITELIKAQNKDTQRNSVVDVYVIPISVQKEGLEIAQRLRGAGLNTDIDLAERGVSDNLKYANAYGIPQVVIVGPKELEQDKVTLRDMTSGDETLLALDDVIERLTSDRA